MRKIRSMMMSECKSRMAMTVKWWRVAITVEELARSYGHASSCSVVPQNMCFAGKKRETPWHHRTLA